jgi:hypothetical protein
VKSLFLRGRHIRYFRETRWLFFIFWLVTIKVRQKPPMEGVQLPEVDAQIRCKLVEDLVDQLIFFTETCATGKRWSDIQLLQGLF